ncbi:putative oxidoreductase [Janthinobacterium sp. HH103]|nr:putative oxidoreductase [Janthinobacterium sp. HH100]OEZ82159.1 putative oxidoreductase [Janthinobacterium sp. HH103]QOU73097.1 hypothetical protein JAB4_025500 [Janthinobacterium sp. HH102]
MTQGNAMRGSCIITTLAQPKESMTDTDAVHITPYTKPAAGWDALKHAAISLRQERVAPGNLKALLAQNQPDGFDCPGCAWPDRHHASTFAFCENGAKAVAANATDIAMLGFKDGDMVDLIGAWDDGVARRADGFRLVSYDIPRGCLGAYYPETNALVPLAGTANGAGTPTSKSVPVLLQAANVQMPISGV